MSKKHPRHRVRHNRRLRRNAEEGERAGLMEAMVMPSLMGAGGMLLAQWLSQTVTSRLLMGQDPRLQMALTGAAAGAVTLMFGESIGVPENIATGTATGMGIAAIMPFLPTIVSSTPPPVATTMLSPASTSTSGLGLMVDVSHYGAPYRGMFGLGDASVPERPRGLPAMSTVIPTDLSVRVRTSPQVKPVSEPFASRATDRGYAGGTFARTLFSGGLF